MPNSQLDNTNGKESLINSGCIETSTKLKKEERLMLIYNTLRKIIKKTNPKLAGVETVFFTKNEKTAFTVSEARGVIILLLKQLEIPIKELTPLQVKVAITGYGKAGKKQVGFMVSKILCLQQELKPDDVSDAAAVAITSLSIVLLTLPRSDT